jgi:hypothetical protein
MNRWDPYGEQAGGLIECETPALPGWVGAICDFSMIEQSGQMGVVLMKDGSRYTSSEVGARFSCSGWEMRVGLLCSRDHRNEVVEAGPNLPNE